MSNPILENINHLMCIKCNSNSWKNDGHVFICQNCGNDYPVKNEKIVTVENHIEEDNWESVSEGFNLFKGNEKYTTVNIIGGPKISDLRQDLNISGLSLNLGSGQDNHAGFLNMDLGQYKPVHIIADFVKIPLVNESVELIVSNSVLEHIYDYQKVINEAYRIMKKGGYFYLCVPNAACIRHHKIDYHRWTQPGLKKIFEDRFEIIDSGACRGIGYALIAYVEALMSYSIKNKFILYLSRIIWRFISKPLFWIKNSKSEDYQALSQTIYVLAKKL